MAEMTAAEAIAVLHNNQYQKHIGNGEYDYIHPLTDAQSKGIESLIEQQAAEIERAKATIDTHSELIEHYKRRAEQAEKENKRMRVCGNCRHISCWGNCDRCSVTDKIVSREDSCRDWEMV